MKQLDIRQWRLFSQRIHGPKSADPNETVAWMGAIQAQSLTSALQAVAVRTQDCSVAEVAAALSGTATVRTWPMRTTLHLVPAVDAAALSALTEKQTHRAVWKRAERLGIDTEILTRAQQTFTRHALDHPELTRQQLFEMWSKHGIPASGPAAGHLVTMLCREGAMAQRVTNTRKPDICFVDLARVNSDVPRDETSTALRTTSRYFLSHGPATARDFARWTGLNLTTVKQLMDQIDSLDNFEHEGEQYWFDPSLPELVTRYKTATPSVVLLPGFDEIILGYANRTPTIDKEHEAQVNPGGNAVYKPFALRGGKAFALWEWDNPSETASATIKPFPNAAPIAKSEMEAASRAFPR